VVAPAGRPALTALVCRHSAGAVAWRRVPDTRSSLVAARFAEAPEGGLRITSAVISAARRSAKLANQVQKRILVRLKKPRSHPCDAPCRPSAEPGSRVSNPDSAFRDDFQTPLRAAAAGWSRGDGVRQGRRRGRVTRVSGHDISARPAGSSTARPSRRAGATRSTGRARTFRGPLSRTLPRRRARRGGR
jgi:hypothetical protein